MAAKASTLPFPKVGIKLSVFDVFIEECGGRAALDGLTTSDVCERHLKPLTAAGGISYCEMKAKLLPRDIATATVFISHAWKLAFLDVVDTLKHHFRHTSQSAVLWFDLFSNNQHAAVDLDFGWWSTTFKSAIAKFGRTVVVLYPWYNPFPLRRAWCLYEIFCSIDCGSKLELAMTRFDEANFVQSVKEESYVVLKMIGTINLELSEAFNPSDKDRIFDVVRSTVGFDALNSAIFERLRVWVIEAVENAIETADTPADQLLLKFGLASLLRQQGRFRESDAHFLNCIQEQRELGDDENLLARFLNGYGYTLWAQNRFDEAEPYILESFDIRKQLLGLDNDETLTSLNTVCQLYRAQKRFDEVEPLSRDLVERRKKLLGEDHSNYLKSLHGYNFFKIYNLF
jgi:tetratricopeptide (TPR) repeat protein